MLRRPDDDDSDVLEGAVGVDNIVDDGGVRGKLPTMGLSGAVYKDYGNGRLCALMRTESTARSRVYYM